MCVILFSPIRDIDSTYMCKLCLPKLDGWVEAWPCRAMADAMYAVQKMKSFGTQAVYGHELWELLSDGSFCPQLGKLMR